MVCHKHEFVVLISLLMEDDRFLSGVWLEQDSSGFILSDKLFFLLTLGSLLNKVRWQFPV
jgi:hypothetical protein